MDHGANIEYRDENGLTPLHRACLWGEIGCVKLLIDHQANVNTIAKDGNSALLR